MASDLILTLISSGVVAAVVSSITTAVVQKRNEKESRLFNAKLEAYKEFASHLESRFVSLTKQGKNLDFATLGEASAKCLLVSCSDLNHQLKAFIVGANDLYQRCCVPDYNEEKEERSFVKLWADGERIEDMMRRDLGFS